MLLQLRIKLKKKAQGGHSAPQHCVLWVTSQEARLVSTYRDGGGKSVGLDYWRSDCDRDVGRGL